MKKILLLNLFISLAFAAQHEADFTDLPQKDAIHKQLLQSEPFQTQQLIPQLAPLIAEYADNTVRGYLMLPKPCMAFPPYCHDTMQVYGTDSHAWSNPYQEKFGKRLRCYDWIITRIICQTESDKDTKENTMYPKSIPLAFVHNKKEGDEIDFVFRGLPFLLICNQRTANANNPEIFEDVLKTLEYIVP